MTVIMSVFSMLKKQMQSAMAAAYSGIAEMKEWIKNVCLHASIDLK